MRIATNISSINTARSVVFNNKKIEKSLQKLSSGFRINSSADDAAGLSISKKMKAQIHGLNRAQQNIQVVSFRSKTQECRKLTQCFSVSVRSLYKR